MFRQSGRALLCVALSAGVCASGAITPGIAAAADDAGSVVAAGVLEDSKGRKVGHNEVTLYAWPSGESMATQVVGDTLALAEINTIKTGPDGQFELSVKDLTKLQRQADRSGIVNFEIVASTVDGPATFTFPKILTTDDQGALALSESDVDAKGCSQRLVEDLGTSWTVVGSTYSTASGINHDLVYSTSAFNELGVGYSATGSYGSFSQEGTAGLSASNSVDFAFMSGAGNRQYRTTIRYGKYEFNCSAYGELDPEHYYKVLPMNHALGNGYVTPPAPPTANYCQPQIGGSSGDPLTVEVANNRSYTWSQGAALSAGIGINLSSRSGYTNESKVRFSFYGNRHLCGSNGDPGVAQLLVGKL